MLQQAKNNSLTPMTALDFFAGSGLVTYSLKPFFDVIWANDISAQKAYVYFSNHNPEHFHLDDISRIKGNDLHAVDLSWASFPCQDLSLAGYGLGIHAERSGLVWEWLRVMDEMVAMPKLLAAENVEGLISSNKGQNYVALHKELVKRGYKVGAVKLNANRWVPQSRPRIFVIAIQKDVIIPADLTSNSANWLHTDMIRQVAETLDGWLWWNMPKPARRLMDLSDIIEWDAPVDSKEKTEQLLALLSEKHRQLLNQYENIVVPGYKRTRSSRQRLELRFDGIAGCLRTPKGGSSRQILIIKSDNEIHTRLLTVRETARLMGAPENYFLPDSYNDAYMAMGDAVAVPVVQHLAEHLLYPLASEVRKMQGEKKGDEDNVAC